MIGSMSPPHSAYAGNKPNPIGGKNEDENSGKEPEGPLGQVWSNDSGQELVKSLEQPFQKILGAPGDLLHASCGELSKYDQAHGYDPADNHRIGDRKIEGASDLYCLRRKAVFLRLRGRCTCCL